MSYVLLADIVKAFPSCSRRLIFGTLKRMGCPEPDIRCIQSLHEGATVELMLDNHRRSWKATSGCKEGSIDSPQHFVALATAMTCLMSFPPSFTPPAISSRNDGKITGRPTNTTTPMTITATHGFYADDTAMITGRSDTGIYRSNDIVACIPGDWLVAARSEIECSAPQFEIVGRCVSNGDLVTTTTPTSPTRTPTTHTGRVGDIDHFNHTFSVTTADGTVTHHTFGKADGTTVSRLSGPMWNVRQGTITAWDPDQRRFAVTNNIGVTEHVELDPPFATAPSWSLVPGPWMAESIVSVQWTPDSNGTPHPPYLATVIGCNDDRSVTVRYHADAVVETERLNNTVKFDNWTLLQTASHIKTNPDSSFRDWDQLRIGGLATFRAMMRVGTRPHYGDASGAASKTLAMVIPAKKPPGWQKGDPIRDPADCKRTPIHIPEYHCADLHRPPGRIDFVDKARLLGDWISEELDETVAADKRVAAATRAFYKLKTRGLICTSRISKQQQGAMFRACVCAVLLDSTETWAMSSSTFTVLRNAFRAFVRALNFKTMWDHERTPDLLDRLGIPDLETMANNRAMRWIGNVARMHPGRLPQQVLYGWMPYPRPRGGQTKHQGHRINRILRDRAANTDPKIRHRFYKNGTDITKITSDTDPVNWHVVAQDRTTWTSTMLTGVPTNPTITRT